MLILIIFDRKYVYSFAAIEDAMDFIFTLSVQKRKERDEMSILLVEDNEELIRVNQRMLEIKGYEVEAVVNIEEARVCLETSDIRLMILDILLPDGSGLDFCKEVKKKYPNLPILFLTALGENSDIVTGLRIGGDDYVSKPYDYEVLLAKIEALLRRTQLEVVQGIKNIGSYYFDHDLQRLYKDGIDLLLKPKEFLLFRLLAEHAGRYYTPEELFKQIWGNESNHDYRTIYAHISNLRSKLMLNDNPHMKIEQKRGKGYRLFMEE